MSCLYCCCCTILVLINIIYLIIGIVILGLGVVFHSFSPFLGTYLVPMLKEFVDPMIKQAGLNIDLNVLLNNIMGYLSGIAIALIIIGVILVVISILGMCSVCCKSKVTLIIYLSILSTIVLIQIIVIIIYATNSTMAQSGVANILGSMIVKYEGLISTNTESVLINLLNILYKCCGIKNYEDFSVSVKWNRNINTDYQYGNKKYRISGTLLFPLSCCKFENFIPVDLNACVSSNSTNVSNKEKGCVTKLFDDIHGFMQLVFKIVGGIIGFQLLIIVAAVICLVSLSQSIKPV